MRGRRVGTREISLEQIELIEKYTKKGYSRRKIAELADCGDVTVWHYQRKLGLI